VAVPVILFHSISLSALTYSFPVIVHAEDKEESAEATTHIISQSILSPFCPGRTLEDCPSSAATELRNQITTQVLSGKSQEDILNHLYGIYGEEIRAAPKKEGFGLVAWLAPLAFLLIGLIVLLTWLSRLRRLPLTADSSIGLDAATAAKIKAEID